MSLDLETKLKTFLASAPQTIWPIQTLEISHSAISQTFNLWREPYAGTTTVDAVVKTMQPCNIEIKLAGNEGHLDQKFDIKLGLADAADIFREQLDRIPVTTTEKIVITYREFLSDDLTAPQAAAVLHAESISYAIGVAVISAVSPRLNISRTGEIYSPKSVPMLRGFF